jgi:hypothetical protein
MQAHGHVPSQDSQPHWKGELMNEQHTPETITQLAMAAHAVGVLPSALQDAIMRGLKYFDQQAPDAIAIWGVGPTAPPRRAAFFCPDCTRQCARDRLDRACAPACAAADAAGPAPESGRIVAEPAGDTLPRMARPARGRTLLVIDREGIQRRRQ